MSHNFTISGRDDNPFEHPLITPSEARRQLALSLALMGAFVVLVCAVSFASLL